MMTLAWISLVSLKLMIVKKLQSSIESNLHLDLQALTQIGVGFLDGEFGSAT